MHQLRNTRCVGYQAHQAQAAAVDRVLDCDHGREVRHLLRLLSRP